MKRNHLLIIGLLGLTVTTAALVSWQIEPSAPTVVVRDTVPQKDLDKQLQSLEEARASLHQLGDRDWSKMHESIKASLNNINLDELHAQLQTAMASIDANKINRSITTSLESIDFDGIEKQVREALASAKQDIDPDAIRDEVEKTRQEVQEQLKNQPWREELEKAKVEGLENARKEIEAAKKELKKAKAELRLNRHDIKKDIKKAQENLDQTDVELHGYQDMIYDLEADGLLNTREGYTIQYENGEMYVNTVRQPAAVTEKYKSYFKQHKKTTIQKKDGDVSINIQ